MVLNEQNHDMVASYSINDKAFLEKFQTYTIERKNSNNFFISKEEFISKFGDAFGRDILSSDEDFAFSYFPDKVLEVQMFEKSIKIDDFSKNNESSSYLVNTTEKNEEAFTPINHDTSKQNFNITCPLSYAHVVTIKPEMIKVGLNGILSKNFNLVLISRPECKPKSVNVVEIAKEASLSFISLIISNYLQDILFSFLNNKDVLDLVKYNKLPKNDMFIEMENFFTTFRCDHFVSINEDWSSFQSNQKIKAFLMKDFKDESSNTREWFDELMRQFQSKYHANILDSFSCKYFLIFPEYLTISLLAVLSLIYVFYEIFFWIYKKQSRKSILICLKIIYLYDFFYTSFMSSLLLIYFYNVTAFCSLIKLLTTFKFGAIDFMILIFRGGFITYPWIEFVKRVYDKKPTQKPNKKIIDNHSKAENKICVKKASTKQIDTKWTKTPVLTFETTSFVKPKDETHSKKRTLFLKHIMKIIGKVLQKKQVMNKSKSFFIVIASKSL